MENDDWDIGVKDDCTFLAWPTRETKRLFIEQTLEMKMMWVQPWML